jgi:hypothetical protein
MKILVDIQRVRKSRRAINIWIAVGTKMGFPTACGGREEEQLDVA